MPALEFMKLEPGVEGYLAQWPSKCICGAQSGPMVDTGIDSVGYGNRVTDPGRIYLCRRCVTRAGRSLGLVKGDEMEKLQNSADELAVAAKEISERQALVERLSASGAEKDQKIETLQSYITTLQGDVEQRKHLANLIASTANELVAV